ncbi:hypothetical protein EI94DRAFT_391783 [Lactarius quietus]|nr:hypothetical protein EI94DRAFT_391783 [Lactarius quietus]
MPPPSRRSYKKRLPHCLVQMEPGVLSRHQDRDLSRMFIVIRGASSERVGSSRPRASVGRTRVQVTRTISRELLIEVSILMLKYLEDQLAGGQSNVPRAARGADQTLVRDETLATFRSPLACWPYLPRRRKAYPETPHSERGSAPAAPALPLAVYACEPVWRAVRRHERSKRRRGDDGQDGARGCVLCTRQGHPICVYPVGCVRLVL